MSKQRKQAAKSALISEIEQAVEALKRRMRHRPRLGIVLGSGFQGVAEVVEEPRQIPYRQIPGFAEPTVAGHAGKVWLGSMDRVPVILLQGRAHYYEGHEMSRVTFAVRVLSALGVRDLILTNAAGGINRRFQPGDFMRFTDHINFMGCNPLRGAQAAGLNRFVDLSQVYDPGLGRLLDRAAKLSGIRLYKGVYLGVSGPSYETPAEIRAFRTLGADAVGMSTIPEAIVARQLGMRVLAVSCITNLAAGLGGSALNHEEVLRRGAAATGSAADLLKGFARTYGQTE